MAFFTLKKRCQYCGSVLDNKGNCPNTGCINHKTEITTESTEGENASNTSKEG